MVDMWYPSDDEKTVLNNADISHPTPERPGLPPCNDSNSNVPRRVGSTDESDDACSTYFPSSTLIYFELGYRSLLFL